MTKTVQALRQRMEIKMKPHALNDHDCIAIITLLDQMDNDSKIPQLLPGL